MLKEKKKSAEGSWEGMGDHAPQFLKRKIGTNAPRERREPAKKEKGLVED